MSRTLDRGPLLIPPLNVEVVGSRVLVLDEVDSTNNYALRLSDHGIVIVAHSQTDGRGRQGRAWVSSPGLGLWFSVGLDGRLPGLSFAAALAVRDALKPYCALQVKWPNDLLLDGKKVCGILVEYRQNRTALGIGLNVHQQPDDFPEPVRETATSLELGAPREWDRGEILRDVLTQLDRQVRRLAQGEYESIRQEWAAACNIQGRRVQYEDTEAVVAGIDGDGALIVNTPSGAKRLLTGEIKVMYGA